MTALTRFMRPFAVTAASACLVVWMGAAGSAQMGGMRDRIVDSVAATMVATIQSDSCAQFAAMLRQHKSSGSSPSRVSGILKSNPASRTRFVNRVAGPLLNKMIDCDLLPGH